MAASTTKKKPAKRMTQREKEERARIKRKLQAEGILPPNKSRLNRRKFAHDVCTEFEGMGSIQQNLYLRQAIGLMVSSDMQKVTEEQVGVLKLLKLAMEIERFERRINAEGRQSYTIKEFVEEVYAPVMDL